MVDLWDAPTASAPIDAVVRVPGSKSLTNRALVIAALASAPTTLHDPLAARDTRLMATALESLGAEVDVADDATWQVRPGPLRAPAEVDCGLAGTVMRFVPPVAALADGRVRFDGDPRARVRPMGPLLGALGRLGVDVTYDDDAAAGLPFTVVGRGSVTGGSVAIDASDSSQFVSGLLLAGYRYRDGLRVDDVGPGAPSTPHIEMTLAVLARRGIEVSSEEGGRSWQVGPGVPSGGDVTVEPDLSNLLPFAAAALATRGRLRVSGFRTATSVQPVAQVRGLLEALGASLSEGDDGELVIDGTAGPAGAGELDMSDLGELVPVTAAVAVLAGSPTTIRGVAHLRGHETDRLAALAKELSALGGDVTEADDGLVIRPARLRGGVFETYDDHRLATAAAVIGLAVPGVRVVDVATTGKTLPGFVELWTGMLGR